MSRYLWILTVVVAGGAGFLLGRADRGDGGRTGRGEAEGRERAPRYAVNVPVEDVLEQQRRVARIDALEAENRTLREQIESVGPGAEDVELPLGARRPDGTIVGGARWSGGFVQVATSFFDSFFTAFIEEANLTPEQERRVREGARERITEAMQITADFVNGDIDGNQAYEHFEQLIGDGRKMVRELLDEGQYNTYRKHERAITQWMDDQVVAKEMAGLRAELRLDSEQEKRVRAIVELRFQRVGERLNSAIPNILITPIRREQDRFIYEETAGSIRELLRPDQQAAFDKLEKTAPAAPFEYRNMLVPK